MKKVILIFGPSGAGKSTAGEYLKELGITELISHTTRAIRPGEEDGLHYYFIDQERFVETAFIESTTYPSKEGHQSYGISRKEIEKKWMEHDLVYAVVDKVGIRSFKEFYPEESYCLFISVKTADMRKRLKSRGDDEENINIRIANSLNSKEFDPEGLADQTVENNNLENTKRFLKRIVKKMM